MQYILCFITLVTCITEGLRKQGEVSSRSAKCADLFGIHTPTVEENSQTFYRGV